MLAKLFINLLAFGHSFYIYTSAFHRHHLTRRHQEMSLERLCEALLSFLNGSQLVVAHTIGKCFLKVFKIPYIRYIFICVMV